MKKNKKKILLGMSGGTDSSVAAFLLKEQGFDIHGITFRSYDSLSDACMEKERGCCTIDSIMEAKHLAEKLNFPHYIIDIRAFFEASVIEYFIAEYLSGNTPNPCVLCNKLVKWGVLLEEADKQNCDFIASGHYAEIKQENQRYFIRQAKDQAKDQSYFLWMLSQENLSRTIFPLANLTKEEVREIAKKYNMQKLATKKESQEICFIPDDNYRNFLREQNPNIDEKIGEGNFVDVQGNVIGKHQGFPFYTIGQRKGLGIAMGHPVYVLDINAKTNTITLGEKEDLLKNELWIKDINFMKYPDLYEEKEVFTKVRYNTKAVKSYAQQFDNRIRIRFEQAVSAITPGQSAVMYEEKDVVAGGIIIKE